MQTALNKEVRKIQLTGKTTYIVSLPKKWVEDLGLSSGSLVTLIKQPSNALLLLPDVITKLKTEEVTLLANPNKSGESLKRMIISAYLAGYNIIHIRNKNEMISSKQKDAIREVVKRNLVGTEIIASTSNFITIQTLASIPELPVKSVIRRMFLLASSMHRDAMNALRELNYELADSIINSDDEIDKFSLYIMRNLILAAHNEKVLRDIGLLKASDILGYRVVVKSIERIADHATSIAEKIKDFKIMPNVVIMNKLDDMSLFALSMFEDSIEALLRMNYELADSVAEKSNTISEMEKNIISMIDNTNLNYYKLILEDIRRVAEYASDISEVAINHTIEDMLLR
ncbi:MAG: phosphate uptake regulator PhoU [Candidatus Nitrosocaldaceae archaeon]